MKAKGNILEPKVKPPEKMASLRECNGVETIHGAMVLVVKRA